MLTTLAIDKVGDVPGGDTRLNPAAGATVTLLAAHAAAWVASTVTAPAVMLVNVMLYGFGLFSVKNTSPPVKPGYRSAAPSVGLIVTETAVVARARPDPVPVADHAAHATPATTTATSNPTPTAIFGIARH